MSTFGISRKTLDTSPPAQKELSYMRYIRSRGLAADQCPHTRLKSQAFSTTYPYRRHSDTAATPEQTSTFSSLDERFPAGVRALSRSGDPRKMNACLLSLSG